MLNFKTFLIATAITFLMLAGFVNSSNAREIVEIGPANWSSNDVYDLGDGAFHRASLTTDEPFYCVWWYINGEYAGWSDGSNVKTRADFTFSGITDGDIAGNAQTISAEVGWLEDNGDTTIDTDSYTITVWEPIFTLKYGAGPQSVTPM